MLSRVTAIPGGQQCWAGSWLYLVASNVEQGHGYTWWPAMSSRVTAIPGGQQCWAGSRLYLVASNVEQGHGYTWWPAMLSRVTVIPGDQQCWVGSRPSRLHPWRTGSPPLSKDHSSPSALLNVQYFYRKQVQISSILYIRYNENTIEEG